MSMALKEGQSDLPQSEQAPAAGHKERHSSNGAVLHDAIIGFADGLTVPFALTAGLSSLGSAHLVIIGGLAELFSGAISMGLGAYLAAVTDRDLYDSEERRERDEVINKPDAERAEIYEIFEEYDIGPEDCKTIVQALERNPEMWVKFMMTFELKLEKPNISRAWISAATMGASYFIGGFKTFQCKASTLLKSYDKGGLIPMIPYFAMKSVTHALFVSIGITVVILLVFGFVKNWVTIRTKRAGVYGALQTLLVGALAAGTSYGIVRAINSGHAGQT